MADATATFRADGGNVAQTLGDLRRRLKEVKEEANATSLSNGRRVRELRDEYKKLDFQIKALTKGKGIFDGLDGAINKAAVRMVTFSAIFRGLNNIFRAAIENNEKLNKKMEGLSAAGNKAAGEFGKLLADFDDAVGVTDNLNRQLTGVVSALKDINKEQNTGKKLLGFLALLSPQGQTAAQLSGGTTSGQTEQERKRQEIRIRLLKEIEEIRIEEEKKAAEKAKEIAKEIAEQEEKQRTQHLYDFYDNFRVVEEKILDDQIASQIKFMQFQIDSVKEVTQARLDANDRAFEQSIEDSDRRLEEQFHNAMDAAKPFTDLMGDFFVNGPKNFGDNMKLQLKRIAAELISSGLLSALGSILFPGTAGARGVGLFGKIFGGLFAGGGEFYTRGPQLIMVGDNPGGVEKVTVEPVSGKGRTRVLNSGAIAMAGGGSVIAGPSRNNPLVTRELVSLQIDSQDVDFAVRKNGKRRNDRRQGR